MPHFSLPELLILLVIVVVLFGVGRVSKIGGEMGSAIREFRKGLNGDQQVPPVSTDPTAVPPVVPPVIPPASDITSNKPL